MGVISGGAHLESSSTPSDRLECAKLYATLNFKCPCDLIFLSEMAKAFGANGAHKNENKLRGTTPHGNPMHLSRKVVYNIRKNVMGLPDNSPM